MCQEDLRNELLEAQKSNHEKMKQQLLLRNSMVENYKRMMEKCEVYDKELQNIRTENVHYKSIGQCLMKKMVELTDCGITENSFCSSNADAEITFKLEACGNQLLADLVKFRNQSEVAARNLAGAREQLATAMKKEECLQRCADNLTVLAEADRTRRDRDETELRTTVKRLTAELDKTRCDRDRLRSSVDDMRDVMEGRKPAPATGCGDELLEENARLQAQLGASFAVKAALQARVANLEAKLRQDCGRVVTPSSRGGERCVGGGSSTSLSFWSDRLDATVPPDLRRGDDSRSRQDVILTVPSELEKRSCEEPWRQYSSQTMDDDKRLREISATIELNRLLNKYCTRPDNDIFHLQDVTD